MEGFKVTYLGVKKNGLVDLNELEKVITPETSLVSIMTVNNEIGVLQPVEDIGKLCRSKKVYFHTDAAQAVGKIPINVDKVFIFTKTILQKESYIMNFFKVENWFIVH